MTVSVLWSADYRSGDPARRGRFGDQLELDERGYWMIGSFAAHGVDAASCAQARAETFASCMDQVISRTRDQCSNAFRRSSSGAQNGTRSRPAIQF